MGAVLAFNIEFEAMECGECGTHYAMTAVMVRKRREDGQSFHCPLGHPRVFRETEVQKLRRQIEQNEKDLEWARAQRDRSDKRVISLKGQVTKIKNRIGNGVCPCCNRSFKNLQRHMSHKHPEFRKEEL